MAIFFKVLAPIYMSRILPSLGRKWDTKLPSFARTENAHLTQLLIASLKECLIKILLLLKEGSFGSLSLISMISFLFISGINMKDIQSRKFKI